MNHDKDLGDLLSKFASSKSNLMKVLKGSMLEGNIGEMVTKLSTSADLDKQKCKNWLMGEIHKLTMQMERGIDEIHTEMSNVAEALYNKSGSPHTLMEKLKVINGPLSSMITYLALHIHIALAVCPCLKRDKCPIVSNAFTIINENSSVQEYNACIAYSQNFLN